MVILNQYYLAQDDTENNVTTDLVRHDISGNNGKMVASYVQSLFCATPLLRQIHVIILRQVETRMLVCLRFSGKLVIDRFMMIRSTTTEMPCKNYVSIVIMKHSQQRHKEISLNHMHAVVILKLWYYVLSVFRNLVFFSN